MEQSDKRETESIQTTIGDLVEAVLQVANEAGKTKDESHRLAAATIEYMLRRQHSIRKYH